MKINGGLIALIGSVCTAIVMVTCVVEFSEIDSDDYINLRNKCTPSGMIFPECKKAMSDGEITNYEYAVLMYKYGSRSDEQIKNRVREMLK